VGLQNFSFGPEPFGVGRCKKGNGLARAGCQRQRRGDGVAFGALVEADLGAMVRLAAVVSGNAADAEDIVQEALTKVLQSLRRFDETRPFRPWFATIVANQARNWKRSRGRRLRLVRRIAVQAQLPERFVEEIVLEADEGSRVVAALQNLDRHDREILALRFLVGLTERESADALGLALGTVKSRTSRALGRMRTQWETANNVTNTVEAQKTTELLESGHSNE
jgi:RNA polymerase sigma factor (sigma-70 family)